jgi:hypothetical protein
MTMDETKSKESDMFMPGMFVILKAFKLDSLAQPC